MNIALVEPHRDVEGSVFRLLQAQAYCCESFSSAADSLQRLRSTAFDVLIVDAAVPAALRQAILAWARLERPATALLVCARGDMAMQDRAAALEMGADMVLAQPFDGNVLRASIDALSRRLHQSALSPPPMEDGLESFGKYRFDLSRRTVRWDNCSVRLARKEFDLALWLFRHSPQIVTRAQISRAVWHQERLDSRTIDTHVSLVRTKLQLRTGSQFVLLAVPGHGYQLMRAATADTEHSLSGPRS